MKEVKRDSYKMIMGTIGLIISLGTIFLWGFFPNNPNTPIAIGFNIFIVAAVSLGVLEDGARGK